MDYKDNDMGNELAFETAEACFEVAKQMIENGHYVVMISMEEQLWILNYLYSDLCDRNDVVFMQRDEFEEKYFECGEEDEED